MKIQSTMTEYTSPVKGRGWCTLRITQEADKSPDVIFTASVDAAVQATTIAEFIQSVSDEHHLRHGVDISGKAASSTLEFFGQSSRRGETSRP